MNDATHNELELISTALTNFDRVAQGLAQLEHTYKGVLYEVDTSLGMAHAKAARAAIREPRYEVERVRKGAKAPLLALGKRLDAQATRITNALMALEAPIVEQIETEEARKEAEHQAKLAAEAKRVADIQARIDGMRNAVIGLAGYPPAIIDQYIEEVDAIPIDASFAEFAQVAGDVKTATLARLQELRAASVAHEAEQRRIKEERAELARLRAEEDARQRTAIERRAQLEQEERNARAVRHAEDLRLAADRADFEEKQREWTRQIENAAPVAPAPAASRLLPTQPLSQDILDAIDGSEERRGWDARLTEWATRARELEDALAAAGKSDEY